MKTKVVFLIRDLNYGGAQRQLVTLVKGMNRELFDITLLYFYPGGALAKELANTGIPAICLEKRQRWDVFGFLGRLIRHLKQIKPDVLHGYLGESNLVTIFVKPFFPSIRTVWGIRESDTDPSLYGWLGRLLAKITPILSRFADLIIINSHAGKKHHVNLGYYPEKMVVIPNGLDIERFQPNPEAGAKLRSEWGISQDTMLIGLVARLDPMKDHPNFLQAAALMLEKRPDICFVCVGTGPEEYGRELYKLTANLGIAEKVIWAGPRADMPAVYNAFDIACSSSAYGEGFANVIGEAMACGVPCVVTDVGDSKSIVGDTGLVVTSKNPQALCDAWLQLLNMDRSALAIMARKRVVENFTTQNLYERTENSLQNIVKNR